MAKGLEGQAAIVTGGARGIGLGIAKTLTERGCRVAVWDLDPDPLTSAGEFMPAHVAELDITDAEAVEVAAASTRDALGQVDILVNNAGVNGPTVPTWDYTLDDWNRVLAVDLTGVFLCCRALAPLMRERGYGRIVNISSIAGKDANANICAYAAAKSGVIGFSKCLAKELVDSGVSVNCITPAMVETDLLQEMAPEYIEGVKAKIPMGRLCTVEEIADMVAWVASPECSFTTGAVFDLSGGRATY